MADEHRHPHSHRIEQLLDQGRALLGQPVSGAEPPSPRTLVGYVVGYRDRHSKWCIDFSGEPFTREAADADLLQARGERPGVDWRVLTVFDDTGEPYTATTT